MDPMGIGAVKNFVFKLSFPQDKYVVGAVSGGVDSSVAAVRNAQDPNVATLNSRCHDGIYILNVNSILGGGFKHFLFSPLFGEDSHFG